MPDDQAHGLRRLFARRDVPLLGVVGENATAIALELAGAYAGMSRRVLLLDRSCGEAALGLGLRARCELRHALTGERTLRQVALDGPPNVVVLPAARAFDAMDAEGAVAWETLCQRLDPELGPFDVLLVNGVPPALPDAAVLLALAPTSTALTHAYAELKKLSRRGTPRRCDVVIHRARTEAAALDAFDSVAITAGRFLGMTLALAGTLPDAPRRPAPGAESERARSMLRIALRLTAEPLPQRMAVNH